MQPDRDEENFDKWTATPFRMHAEWLQRYTAAVNAAIRALPLPGDKP